jgi:hypothetical protein
MSIKQKLSYDAEKEHKKAEARSRELQGQSVGPVGESVEGKARSLGRLVGLPDVPELPRDVARRAAELSKHDWTDDDWMDVLRAQRIVAHNLAIRHGLLKQPNV